MSQLISPAELMHLQQHGAPIILDCRSDLNDSTLPRQWFQAGHLPGAQPAHLEDDLSGPIVPGQTGRHPLPEPDTFAKTLSRWGVQKGASVVVYDQANGMFAARAWWLLKWAGLSDVRVLNGGLQGWLDDGGELTTERTEPDSRPYYFTPDNSLVADVETLLTNAADHRLLDARALPRYRGDEEPLDAKAGHIPGAVNAEFTRNLTDTGRFQSAESLKQRFATIADKNLVCYCGSGVTACHNILAITEAGLPMPRLYPGSWSEWIINPEHPIATGEEGVI